MKRNLLLLISIVSTSFVFTQSKAISLEKIVAQIGDNIILQSDIDAQKLQLKQNGEELTNNSNCQVIESLIMQNLLLNQAEIDSVKISDSQVEAEMENRLRVIERQIGSKQKMEEFYGKTSSQLKTEFRPIIKKKLMTEEMQRSITTALQISPKEIEAFYAKLPEDSVPLINTKLTFQQIVIFPSITNEDKQNTISKLSQIRSEIINGKNFETQARINSQDPGSASQGGTINASRGMMVAPFESTVFALKAGEISSIVETEYGYHIIQLIDRKGDDYTCRHILLIPEFTRESLMNSNNKMDECHKKLISNELTWNQAVLKYSNDKNTKYNAGIITNPITGEQTWSMEDLNQVDQQIYILTDVLKIGDYTKPSLYFDINERKQGIRIVRLIDRTNPHKANLTEDYTLIQNAALNKKKQSLIDSWVNLKMENAFIRIDQDYQSCNFNYKWIHNQTK